MEELRLQIGGVGLSAELVLPERPGGVVIFAHGSGSTRRSPRNRAVAAVLHRVRLGTLLFDLLTEEEGRRRELTFDISLLAERLEGATRWAIAQPQTRELPVGYFGASTGAAAALCAAAALGETIRAVVSRGGRPDLAADRLAHVSAPTLLLVGGGDADVLELNRQAGAMLRCAHRLTVIDGADHLFTQPRALEAVARLAAEWFQQHLVAASAPDAAASA